jgi:hypothetical protein
MTERVFPANQCVEIICLGLHLFQVLFLWLHDWIPLGGFNDVAARYEIMFGKTYHFLPTRNGLVPNTAHTMLHLATAAILFTLLVN